MIRLLPKSEIDKRKAEEQRLALQEGLKVAKRVDTLREIAASEEAAFEKYRTTSLKDIQSDIQLRFQEKEQLEADLVKMRSERNALLVPITHKWLEIEEVEGRLNTKEAALSKEEAYLIGEKIDLDQRVREAKAKEGRAEDLKTLASAMFSKAEKTVATAKEESANMRNRAQAELSLVELKDLEVSKREQGAIIKEAQIKERESRIEKYEADLAKREHTLRAGWKNLERTANKLKQ